jgi:hypothetical protein
VPVAIALAGAAAIPALWYSMAYAVDLTVGDGDDDLTRFISLASAIGSAMEGAFVVSCWAAFVAVSRLLHRRRLRTRRIVAGTVTAAWLACLVALQFATVGPYLD